MGVEHDIKRLFQRVLDEEDNNKAAAAARLNTNAVTFWGWLNGSRGQKGRQTFYKAIDLAGGRLIVPGDMVTSSNDYDFVPKHAARPGAGSSLETSDETVGMYAFRKEFMARQGIYADNAVLLDVIGDSMEPLLYEGDTILVDKHDIEIRDGKIYVVTLGEELRVKRIYKSMNGLILRSENTRYPDVPVTGPDLETFRVHGRVKWCGKIL